MSGLATIAPAERAEATCRAMDRVLWRAAPPDLADVAILDATLADAARSTPATPPDLSRATTGAKP